MSERRHAQVTGTCTPLPGDPRVPTWYIALGHTTGVLPVGARGGMNCTTSRLLSARGWNRLERYAELVLGKGDAPPVLPARNHCDALVMH